MPYGTGAELYTTDNHGQSPATSRRRSRRRRSMCKPIRPSRLWASTSWPMQKTGTSGPLGWAATAGWSSTKAMPACCSAQRLVPHTLGKHPPLLAALPKLRGDEDRNSVGFLYTRDRCNSGIHV